MAKNKNIFLTLSLVIGVFLNLFSQQFSQGLVYIKVRNEHRNIFNNSLQKQKLSFLTYLNIDKIDYLVRQRASRPYESLSKTEQEVRKIYRLHFDSNIDVEQQILKLKATGYFEIVEPAYIFDVQMGYQPNDPLADSTALEYQIQLKMHGFYDAFALEKGDTNVTIGVVDTGVNYHQIDAIESLSRNFADTIDGINNDGDVYFDDPITDNFMGWDLADWDNDASLGSGSVHGAAMISVVASTPDNDTGMVGSGFYCRYIPYKVSPDAFPNSISHGYDGILMAAIKGAKIINCSWGDTDILPQIFEDVVNYAILELDAIIVSAAGNEGNQKKYYPASYPLVVSVAALKTDTSLAIHTSNYNYQVDLAACGNDMLMSDGSDSDYRYDQGTSVATALVSGYFGLIRSHFPEMTAMQARQQAKVTADYIDQVSNNNQYTGQIGKMINPVRALLDTVSPGIYTIGYAVNGNNQEVDKDGEDVLLDLAFVNFLRPSTNVNYTLSAVSDNFEVLQNTGLLPDMQTMDTILSLNSSIELSIYPSLDTIEHYILRIDFEDANGYHDHDYVFFDLKPTKVTAIQTINTPKWNVYPTKATQLVHIEGDFTGIVQCDLLDLSGKKMVSQSKNNSSNLQFTLPDYVPVGSYYLSIKDQRQVQIVKITKI